MQQNALLEGLVSPCLFICSVKRSKAWKICSFPLSFVLWDHFGDPVHSPYLVGCTISSSGTAQWISWRCGWASSSSKGPDNVCRIIWLSNGDQSEQLHQRVTLPELHENAKVSTTLVHQILPRKIMFAGSKRNKKTIWAAQQPVKEDNSTGVCGIKKGPTAVPLKQTISSTGQIQTALWTFELSNNPQQCFLGTAVIMNRCSHLDTSSYC